MAPNQWRLMQWLRAIRRRRSGDRVVLDVQVNFPGPVYVEITPTPATYQAPALFVPAAEAQPPAAVQLAPVQLAAPVCSCAADLYNCGDFASRIDAEACFDLCIRDGYGDIHDLDADWDGMICEGQFQ